MQRRRVENYQEAESVRTLEWVVESGVSLVLRLIKQAIQMRARLDESLS